MKYRITYLGKDGREHIMTCDNPLHLAENVEFLDSTGETIIGVKPIESGATVERRACYQDKLRVYQGKVEEEYEREHAKGNEERARKASAKCIAVDTVLGIIGME